MRPRARSRCDASRRPLDAVVPQLVVDWSHRRGAARPRARLTPPMDQPPRARLTPPMDRSSRAARVRAEEEKSPRRQPPQGLCPDGSSQRRRRGEGARDGCERRVAAAPRDGAGARG
ncbi:hypothetical protein ZWY2020_020686 [Hordeum vulgare]|nr:hypothetical protein ZWY2020_020686 [Hordeum vulgare]